MITFIEESHQYINGEGEELISVSKFAKKFEKKKDWNSIAMRVAKKETKNGNPSSTKDILDKWAQKRDFSAAVGTIFHALKEDTLLSMNVDNIDGIDCQIHKSEKKDVKISFPINTLDNNTIYPELMIYDLDYMICGQADKVAIVDNTINIIDYKTDKELSFNSFSSKWVKPETFLPPISHLEECNGNMYSIKMSMYMYMLWKANNGKLKPGKIIIEHNHLLRDEDGFPILTDGLPTITKVDIIELPYRKKEVIDMLKSTI